MGYIYLLELGERGSGMKEDRNHKRKCILEMISAFMKNFRIKFDVRTEVI